MSETLSKPTQAYNLLWMSPRFAVTGKGKDTQFHQPIPNETVENMLGISLRNPGVDVRLWIDSKRLTTPQMSWIEDTIGGSTGNMSLQDLRSIPEYNSGSLYKSPDNSLTWRLHKSSLIWRQVDAARILACLQGNYDQVYYSDADVTNLIVNSAKVQRVIARHGVILAGTVVDGQAFYENSLFGFDQNKSEFFRLLYDKTVKDVQRKKINGYSTYIELINTELIARMGINTKEVVYHCKFNGTYAKHAGLPEPPIYQQYFPHAYTD